MHRRGEESLGEPKDREAIRSFVGSFVTKFRNLSYFIYFYIIYVNVMLYVFVILYTLKVKLKTPSQVDTV